jgi:predicted deacylase
VLGLRALPGQYTYGVNTVATLASGMQVQLPVHVLHGSKPGPRLGLISTSHGDEVFSIGLLRSILEAIDPRSLVGTVVAVPVANPPGLDTGTRNTPFDAKNLNRLFPGDPQGTLSQRIAARLHDLLTTLDCVIDFHCGTIDLVTNHILMQDFPGEYGQKVRRLSRLYGLELLHLSAGYLGTITGAAADLGITGVVVEIGGGPALEDRYVAPAVEGVKNIMAALGMRAEEPKLPGRQILIRDMAFLRPKRGGVFYPRIGVDWLAQVVLGGTILGEVVDPNTLKVVERLKAPYAESLLVMIRTAFSRVQPGDFAYFIGNMESVEILEALG